MLKESSVFSKWLPIIFIPVLIIAILGLSCWFFVHRRRNNKKSNKVIKPIPPKTNHLPSLPQISTTKSLSISSSQLTDIDKAYLDKLVRTASDRSVLSRDYPKKEPLNKLRKVPSGQKTLFSNIQI
jgi:hypothetical protein